MPSHRHSTRHRSKHFRQRGSRRRAPQLLKRRVFLFGLFAGFLALLSSAVALILKTVFQKTEPTLAAVDLAASLDEADEIEAEIEAEEEEDLGIIVALDAGHGGGDVGAIGIIEEYIMTHAVVDVLYALFEEDERFAPVVTHDIDGEYMLPSERAAVANELGAEVLVSVHGNYDTSESSYGFECYTVTPGHDLNEESLVFASYIVDEFETLGARIRGANGIRYVYYDEDNNRTMVESTDMTVLPNDTFTLLEDANCPAVLVEQCFVSSPDDVATYCSDEGIVMCAEAYYTAICNYFGLETTSI